MHTQDEKPSVVLICHEQDPLDTEGLASWLASSLRLAGLIIIRDPRSRLWRAARREIRRVGWLRFLDVVGDRDFERVGMTLLRVDPGIDTGPIFFHGTCDFDEVEESHSVIQYRTVTENLDTIASILTALSRGEQVTPIAVEGRASAVWGQPHLTAYLRWKWQARRRLDASRIPALSLCLRIGSARTRIPGASSGTINTAGAGLRGPARWP